MTLLSLGLAAKRRAPFFWTKAVPPAEHTYVSRTQSPFDKWQFFARNIKDTSSIRSLFFLSFFFPTINSGVFRVSDFSAPRAFARPHSDVNQQRCEPKDPKTTATTCDFAGQTTRFRRRAIDRSVKRSELVTAYFRKMPDLVRIVSRSIHVALSSKNEKWNF